MTVECWCCGRPTEGQVMSLILPKALVESFLQKAAERGVTESVLAQEALSYYLFPTTEQGS